MREDPVAVVRPQEISVPPEALALVSRSIAERFHVCPVGLSESRSGMRTLTVATADPSNLGALDQLQQLTRCRINPVQASDQDVIRGIEMHYGGMFNASPADLINQMATNGQQTVSMREDKNTGEPASVATTTVENVIQRAINERVSDIHIEPQVNSVFVRFRIDGIMYDNTTYELPQHPQIVSRLKILSKLDISITRLPQYGRFDVAMGDKEFDVRVSVVPATTGEKVVLRLLPKGPIARDLAQLGANSRNQAMIAELINKPFGMMLATGPTGSGKTTTLYACLASVDCVAKNVITVEDPVEYQLPRITQLQVHPKAGMTFANGLRAILRQDPDVIMVGEIRDLETLDMAVHSALTGHLVLSTLHCNDAAAAAARMVDMGTESFLVASSVNGLIAQRLVRRICESCKEEAPITDLVRTQLGLPKDHPPFYRGRGCSECRETGYRGRTSVFEVVPMIEPIQQAIMGHHSATAIRAIIRDAGFRSLREDGMEKAFAGITSLEEVMRAVYVEA